MIGDAPDRVIRDALDHVSQVTLMPLRVLSPFEEVIPRAAQPTGSGG